MTNSELKMISLNWKYSGKPGLSMRALDDENIEIVEWIEDSLGEKKPDDQGVLAIVSEYLAKKDEIEKRQAADLANAQTMSFRQAVVLAFDSKFSQDDLLKAASELSDFAKTYPTLASIVSFFVQKIQEVKGK